MTKTEIIIVVVLVMFMAIGAIGLGRWSAILNPDGIQPHALPAAQIDSANPVIPANGESRNAFSFGASLALLGASLLYCIIAAVLFLRRKSQGLPPSVFIYIIAGIAGLGFVLSYVIDDYFY